jgi:hypothetical protein
MTIMTILLWALRTCSWPIDDDRRCIQIDRHDRHWRRALYFAEAIEHTLDRAERRYNRVQ